MADKIRNSKRLSIIGGIALIVIGIPGLFLPFLQGLLFIGVGIYLLSLHLPRIAAMQEKATTHVKNFKEKKKSQKEEKINQ